MPEYINLRNHQVYNYEWDHEGEAVVLLHGGLSKTYCLGLLNGSTT